MHMEDSTVLEPWQTTFKSSHEWCTISFMALAKLGTPHQNHIPSGGVDRWDK
jgi:hypothetical protein